MSRVLVVEDDPDILKMVMHRLSKDGHRVLGAASGPEAMSAVARSARPEAVVLDVSMPHMSGLELLQRLRALDGMRDLPAVFLSARVAPADVEAGRRLGAQYLTRPFVATALLTAVRRALRQGEPEVVVSGL